MKVKCVFQGGGAKLATLIAAAEALEELERNKEIEVTEVAGTSAGALAAYLFAHRNSISELRAKAKAAAGPLIRHFGRKRSALEIVFKLWRGNSIFNEDELRQFIRNVIAEPGRPRPKLSEARIPIHICVADLRQGTKQTLTGAHGHFAEQALIDSCAIPLALRSFRNGSPYVDGGIVSNLVEPSVFENHKGRIIAFSFERGQPHDWRDLTTFLGSLVTTVIDTSVAESMEKIRSVGGEICMLPLDFHTFDFQGAFEEGLSDKYAAETKELIKGRIRNALANLTKRAAQIDGPSRILNLGDFCSVALRAAVKRSPYSVLSDSVICIANGLIPGQPTRDQLIKDVVIKADSEHIVACKIGIARNDVFDVGGDVNWEITDANGKKLEAIHEIVESRTGNDESAWHAHFYLHEPVPKGDTPLRIRLVTTHEGLMDGLLHDGGTDWMRKASGQDSALAVQDFVLCIPANAGAFKMADLLDNAHRAADLPDADIEKMRPTWCVGRPLRKDELSPYQQAHLHLTGYEFIGWRATNVPPHGDSGVLIERIRPR